MSPHDVASIAKHLRRLRRARIIDAYDYSVADAMLWQLRKVSHGITRASYTAIARVSGVCRDKVQKSIAKLASIGLFAKQTHRIAVRWGWNKSHVAVRQDTNSYTWSTEAAGPPVIGELENKQGSMLSNKALAARQEAQSALDRVLTKLEDRLRRHHDPIHHPTRAV